MQKHTQRMITGLVTVGASLALAQPAQAQTRVSDIPGAVVLERILVKVNGGLITQTELEKAQISVLRVRGAPPQTDAELRRVILEITPDLIVDVVEELLLVQRAPRSRVLLERRAVPGHPGRHQGREQHER